MDDATQSLCFTGQATAAGHRAERRTNVNKAPSDKPLLTGGLFKRAKVDLAAKDKQIFSRPALPAPPVAKPGLPHRRTKDCACANES